MPEDTGTEIRIPINRGFVKILGSATLSSKKGIRALYGKWKDGTKKMATIIFKKSKGWNMEKAKAWVRDHRSSLSGESNSDIVFFTHDMDSRSIALLSEQYLDKDISKMSLFKFPDLSGNDTAWVHFDAENACIAAISMPSSYGLYDANIIDMLKAWYANNYESLQGIIAHSRAWNATNTIRR